MNKVDQQPVAAFLVALGGILALSTMDAVMKGLSTDIGAFSTMCWRALVAVGLLLVPYLALRGAWPTRKALRLHLVRGALMVPMGFLFFWGLVRVPMAQAIALTFVAPLMALFLAAVMLGEPVGRKTLLGSLLAAAGVAVIFYGQGQSDLGPEAVRGSLAILGSAVCYAFNIVVMRSQAQHARPLEIAFFQFLFTGLFFWLAALAVGVPPYPAGSEGGLLLATILSIAGMLLLAWAYARAGAGYLSASEYSGFVYAIVLGWLVFGETVSPFTIAGAVLIVAGCIVAARTVARGEPAVEVIA